MVCLRYPESWSTTMTAWIKMMRAERLAPRTISFYKETITAVAHILAAHNRPVLPRRIKTDDVEFLLDYFAQNDYAVQTRKGYIQALKKWCSSFDAPVIREWPTIRYPIDKRPNVDWLSPDQVRRLLQHPMSTVQSTVIHCELNLGMRHVEVIRLKISDIDWENECLRVLGKGPEGGSPRLIPFAANTRCILESMIRYRSQLVDKMRARYPVTGVEPPNLMIWERGCKLHEYSEEGYGLDKVVCLPLTKELGFHFSNHTLRRTFGRSLFRAGVPVPTIARILGHESTDITLRYIGVDLDDMRAAMRRLNYD